MKKISKISFVSLLFFSSLNALEFGTMGSQSFGMAGTGVAVKKSAWGLYYNPALIAADSGFKLGLFAELHAKSKNFWNIFNRDFKKLNQNDIEEIKQLLEDNRISLGTQDGVVLQLPDFGIGALAIGGFFNLAANGTTQAKIELPKDKTTIEDLGLETNFSALALIEIPLGYAYEFDTLAGDFSVGVALKYMNLSGTAGNFKISSNMSPSDSLKDLLKVDLGHNVSNIGVDVGVTYEPFSFLTLGVVGKNLNAPSFDLGFQKIKINPQARAGAALNIGFWTLALDADLTKNQFLGSNLDNQVISLGTSFDFKFFSLRGGVATDLQNKEDLIFSLGLGLAFFDIGVQVGKKTNPLNGLLIPDYLALQVGAGFSF
ncbi:conjugal transfer protein TraF [Helicobacter kayseriensis]|uniref:conjugal transfer protein TraF n=1 Tax=Helicobacter kayseriensis TaxID=2905877 RepID=UPI001E336E33|nr:conjugal transfer protein TraF [Helicobacter kayseriensis]MCE3047412.1 conjugal transfer protein TraF [Helicobacter kayseriensis]MCE3048917.1 conjugal transfer protein TraF [Helicobacter kayseriensis]